MARKVFFSFHYDDVSRANVVRKSDTITRQYQMGARFYDKSLWEDAKKQGSLAIKRMIDNALEGSSVTCVLIGQQTWQREWVRYEILKSMARGNGILGVNIHDVGFDPADKQSTHFGLLAPQTKHNGFLSLGTSQSRSPTLGLLASSLIDSGVQTTLAPLPGPNPLQYLGYTIERSHGLLTNYGSVVFHEVGPNNQWQPSLHVKPELLGNLGYLSRLKDADNLTGLFPVYDWKRQNGFQNFHIWVENAAKYVGR
ncbi:MAG: hypothetical protein Dbin4_00217 [Alphaproteobacteria bacterium]|nr:hypothetical protein [Alphaproteobacteria bacterium]